MTEKISLRALFFDMNGVLVDVSRSYRRAIEDTVEHFTGRQILPNTIERYKEAGDFNDDRRLTHAIVTDTGMGVPFRRVVSEFQRRYRGENWNGLIKDEPALISHGTLKNLHKDRVLGVITTRPEDEAVWTLSHFGWRKYFPLVVPREKHEGRFEPDPFALHNALAILDAAGRSIAPSECAYICGTVEGVVAGRKAEMWTIGVALEGSEDSEALAEKMMDSGAHHVVSGPNEVTDVLERLHEIVAPEEPLESV